MRPIDEILNATPEQLRVWCAEAIGLKVLGKAGCIYSPEGYWQVNNIIDEDDLQLPVYLNVCACDLKEDYDAEILGHTCFCLEVVPEYQRYIDKAWTLQERIDTNSLKIRYVQALATVFLMTREKDDMPDWDETLWWMYANASATDRCRAFLIAMRTEGVTDGSN